VTDRGLEYRLAADLPRAAANPKAHDLDAIVASLREFGWTTPCLLDERTGRLVAGHGRLDAIPLYRHQYPDHVPAGVQVDDAGGWLVPVVRGWASSSDAQAAAYLAADNRLSERGGWDDDALAALLQEVADHDPGLVEAAGWDLDELDDLLAATDAGQVLPDQPTGAHYADSNTDAEARTGTGSTLAARGLTEAVLVLELAEHERYMALVQRLRGQWGVELSSGAVVLRALEAAAAAEGLELEDA
jgi:hypothetical protein